MNADYVIVGAGSAGCVLADRLSADGRSTVTVIEAGGSDRRFWITVPLGYGRVFYDPKVNWMYRTDPDPGLGGRADYWPRGKVLGGSSSINAMVYIRGDRSDFDDWAAEGNPGWSWRDIEPYFLGIEKASGGPLHVTDVSARIHPTSRRLIEAGESLQLPFNPDFNGASQEGVGYYRLTISPNSRRMSASRAFLRPAMKRPNVRLVSGAHVERLHFEGRRARRLTVLVGGERRMIEARREIILAAGAIGSPMLLQRSGVGPGELLSELGIPVLHDNPNVGANLQDHLGISYFYRSRVPTLNNELGSWWGRMAAGVRYLMTGGGPLGLSVNHSGGFFRTDPSMTRPNMQLYFQGLTTIEAKAGTRPLLYPDPYPAFNIGIYSCRPRSRGWISIHSANPLEPPRIEPNSFSVPEDLSEMVAGMKFVRRLAETPAFAEIIERQVRPERPCETDEEVAADIRARCGTVFHPSCTCRMSPDEAHGVVDSRLRVHGLDGLRVIDASIFPNVPSGNLNAPTMAVGAKGAAMILEDRDRA